MMAQFEKRRSRAVLIGITGPIRAGKSWTAGNLIRALHPERFQKLVEDNLVLLNGEPSRIGSYLRGCDGIENSGSNSIWHSVTPEQRLILCLDPWAKCENLDVSSVGDDRYRRRWAQDAFQLIQQDQFLTPAKNKPNLLKAILKAKERIDTDETLSPYLIIEGHWLLQHTFLPEKLLPLLDYLVVLHASEELILRRNPKGDAKRNKQAWDKECAPYLRELSQIFPCLCPPERPLAPSQDGAWHLVTQVAIKTKDPWGNMCDASVPNLQLWVGQFTAPNSQPRLDEIVAQVVAKLQKRSEPAGIKRKREDS